MLVMCFQMLVEGMVGLKFGNECGRNNFVATVVNHGQLVLKITYVAFEGLSWFHFDGEEVVAVFLKLLLRCILVEEGITNLFEAPDRS